MFNPVQFNLTHSLSLQSRMALLLLSAVSVTAGTHQSEMTSELDPRAWMVIRSLQWDLFSCPLR